MWCFLFHRFTKMLQRSPQPLCPPFSKHIQFEEDEMKVHWFSYEILCMCSLYRSWYKDDLCALAFKVVQDRQRGPMVFVRIYSGTMKAQSAVYNVNKNCTYVLLI